MHPCTIGRKSCVLETLDKPRVEYGAEPVSSAEAGTEPRSAIGLYALKENDQFLVADARGDITGTSEGLFRDDTRVLSRYTLHIGGAAPSLLRAGVSDDNVFFRAHVTNRPLPELGGKVTPTPDAQARTPGRGSAASSPTTRLVVPRVRLSSILLFDSPAAQPRLSQTAWRMRGRASSAVAASARTPVAA